MAKNKKPTTIPEICRAYPDSKGKVFYISGHEYRMFWLNSNMQYIRKDNIHAKCDVITVDLELGMMFVEKLTIRQDQECLSMSCSEYYQKIQEKLPQLNGQRRQQFTHFGF